MPTETALPSDPGESSPPPRSRPRFAGALGMALTVALSFAWGALAYRELGPARAGTDAAATDGAVAVAGSQAAPAWVDSFATSFCAGDADALATHLGPPLTAQAEAIKQALHDRDWECAGIHYIGGGTGSKGSFYVYVISEANGREQWWVFTALDGAVVAIE